MKNKISILTAALSLAVSATYAQNAKVEIDEINESIIATLNGTTTIPIILTGPQNGWTIELPLGYALAQPSLDLFIGEPESSLQYNEILVGTQPRFLTWTSDIQNGTHLGLPTSITILNAGTLPTGAPFDLVLADRPASVPDGSSTSLLFGLGLLGLYAVSHRRVAGKG